MSNLLIVQLAVKAIERYAHGLIELIESLPQDRLWSKEGNIPNSIGTLTRHLTGNLNHYFGAGILKNGYVRQRDREFSETGLLKAKVIADLQAAVGVAKQIVGAIDEAKLEQPYTSPCGEEYESLAEHIVRLATHFALHCGQADYAKNYLLRRTVMQSKYIILIGPPASGKGTQAVKLRDALALPHVASGDLFRENLKNETALGKLAKTYMDRGELVPDDVTIQMVMERLSRPDCAAGALLDGFPRTLAQAEALDEALAAKGQKIGVVPCILVPDEVLVERVSGRRLCRTCGESYHVRFNPPKTPGVCDKDGGELYQRDDDNEETMRKRLQVYWAQTNPLVAYYRQQGVLVEVDGNQAIDKVEAELRAAVA
ncbi:MAG: adenylate kinase [Thermoflexales bacterium]|nr:adenylate kinase [Thermoflexales bacterium]